MSAIQQMIVSYKSIDPNLIAWYKLDGNSNDSAGNNNGTGIGVTYVTGRVGDAVKTTGSSGSYVNIPDSTPLRATTISIGMLVKFDGTQGGIEGIIMRKDTASGTRYLRGFRQNASTQTIEFQNFNSAVVYSVSKVLDTNWHYIVGVITGANETLKLYSDGLLVSSVTIGSWGSPTGAIFVGKDPLGSNLNRAGTVDDIKIYNRVLTPTEIADQATAYGF